MSATGQTAAETVATGHRETRRKHRHRSQLRSAARKRWTGKDVSDDAEAGDAGETDDLRVRRNEQRTSRHMIATHSHDQSVNEDGHLSAAMSHRRMFPAAGDSEIANGLSTSNQLDDVAVSDHNSRSAKLSLQAVKVGKSDASLTGTLQTDVVKLRSGSRNCDELDGNAVSKSRQVKLRQPVVDITTPVSRQLLQKARSEAAKNRLLPRRRTHTTLATPGRAGNLRQTNVGRVGNTRQITARHVDNWVKTTPGLTSNLGLTTPARAGNLRQTTPGRAGNLRQTTPGRAGKPRQSTPGHAGKPRQSTPGRAGNLRQTTPGRAGKPRETTPGHTSVKRRSTSAEDTATPTATHESPSPTRDTGVTVLSLCITRLFSCSPALKRNAKGETALHTAAIKVVH